MWEKITNYESAKITQKRKSLKKLVVKIVKGGLCLFYFLSFIFLFLFLLSFIFLFLEQFGSRVNQSRSHISHKLMAQSRDWSQDSGEGSRGNQNKVTSYNMDTTCWPHVLLMVVQGRLHSSQHGPWRLVYKVDYFVLRTLSSSLVLLNTRVVLSLKLSELQIITLVLLQSSYEQVNDFLEKKLRQYLLIGV